MTPDEITKVELLNLLAAAIDGIDGYESETGDLRYREKKKIERTRRIIDKIATSA